MGIEGPETVFYDAAKPLLARIKELEGKGGSKGLLDAAQEHVLQALVLIDEAFSRLR